MALSPEEDTPTFTVTKETDSSFTEDEVEPQLMLSGWVHSSRHR